MSRLSRLFFALGLGLGIVACGDADEPPNIILILADDLGFNDIGPDAIARTPHLDSMASGGMRFTDFHSVGTICVPTRAALMTGRYPGRFDLDQFLLGRGLPPGVGTIAEMLRAAGYRTGLTGKWHLGSGESSPTRQGFDEFVGHLTGHIDYHTHVGANGYLDWWHGSERVDDVGYATDLITQNSVRFIEANREGPFFLFVSYNAPHTPYQGPYDAAVRSSGGDTPEKRREILAADTARIPNPPPGYEERDTYPEMIESMDAGIGAIMDALREADLEDRTLVVFQSDNGPTHVGSAAPLRGGKATVWEGGHRVPTLAYWPGRIEAGAVSNQIGMGIDWLQTFLGVAGVDPPEELVFDGVDLGPVLFGGGEIPERTLFWRYRGYLAARRGPWKLVARMDDRWLFNLDRDVAEEHDLAAENHARVEALYAELETWAVEIGGIPLRYLPGLESRRARRPANH